MTARYSYLFARAKLKAFFWVPNFFWSGSFSAQNLKYVKAVDDFEKTEQKIVEIQKWRSGLAAGKVTPETGDSTSSGSSASGNSKTAKSTDEFKSALEKLNTLFLEAEGINKSHYDQLDDLQKLYTASRIGISDYQKAISILYRQEKALTTAVDEQKKSLTGYIAADKKHIDSIRQKISLIGKSEVEYQLLTAAMEANAQTVERITSAKESIEDAYQKQLKHSEDVYNAQIRLAKTEVDQANARQAYSDATVAAENQYKKAIEDTTASLQKQGDVFTSDVNIAQRAKMVAEGYQTLLEKNEQFAIDFLMSEDERLAAELAKERKYWEEVIALTEEGSEERARLIREVDQYLQNRAIEPFIKKWQDNIKSVEDSLTDALMRGFENGEGFAENFTKTLKNAFQTMILRPVIEATIKPITTSISNAVISALTGDDSKGSSGIIGSLGSALSNNIGTIASGISKWFSAGSAIGTYSATTGAISALGTSIGTTAANVAGSILSGASVTATASAGAATTAASSATSATAGATAAAGAASAAVPVIGLAIASIMYGLSQHRIKSYGGTYAATYGRDSQRLNEYQSTFAGGWNLDFVKGTVEALNTTYRDVIEAYGGRLKDEISFGAFYENTAGKTSAMLWLGDSANNGLPGYATKEIELSDEAIAAYSKNVILMALQASDLPKQIESILNRVDAKDASEEDVDAVFRLADFALYLRDEVNKFWHIFHDAIDFDGVEALQVAGEDIYETFSRLITEFEATNALALILGQNMTTAFGDVGMASYSTRARLLELAGGLESFTEKLTFFTQNFYTEQEIATKEAAYAGYSLVAAFNELAMEIPNSRNEFRKLVEGLDLSSESGQKLYTSLMNTAVAFDTVAKEYERMIAEAEDAVLAAKEALLSLYDEALDAAQSKVDDYIDKIVQAFNDALSAAAEKTANAKGNLQSIIQGMFDEVVSNAEAAKQQLKDLYDAQLSAARQIKDEAYSSLQSALQSIADSYVDRVKSAEDDLRDAYQKERDEIQKTIDRLVSLSGSLRELSQSLLLSDKTTLNPEQQYQEAARQFWDTVTKANAGDVDAMAELSSVGQDFLKISQEYFASSAQYAKDFDAVRLALESAADYADAQAAALEADKASMADVVGQLIDLNEAVTKTIPEAIESLKQAREDYDYFTESGFKEALSESDKAIIDRLMLWDDPIMNIESYLNGISPSVSDAASQLEAAIAEVSRLETEGITAILTENQKQQLKALGLLNDPIFATGEATAETIPDALDLIVATQEKLAKWQTEGWKTALSQSDAALLESLGLLRDDLVDLNGATQDVSQAVQDWATAYQEELQLQSDGIKAILTESQIQQLEALGDIADPLWMLSGLPEDLDNLITGLIESSERLTDLQLNGVKAILDANQIRELEALGLLQDPLLGIRTATSLTIPDAVENLKNAQIALVDLQNKGITGIIEELRKQTNLMSDPGTSSGGDWSLPDSSADAVASVTKKLWVEVLFDKEQSLTGWYSREDYDKFGWSLPIVNTEYRARGGDVAAGQYFVAGEEGPELLRLKSAAHVTPAGTTRGIIGNQETVKQLEVANQLLSALLRQSHDDNRVLANKLASVESRLETIENKTLLAAAAV